MVDIHMEQGNEEIFHSFVFEGHNLSIIYSNNDAGFYGNLDIPPNTLDIIQLISDEGCLYRLFGVITPSGNYVSDWKLNGDTNNCNFVIYFREE